MTGTLAGKKKDVYVTMKIMKKCTKADITSFKVQTLYFSYQTIIIIYFPDEIRC